MTRVRVLQGRHVSDTDIESIRALFAEHPAWGRTRVSEELCRQLGLAERAGTVQGHGGADVAPEKGRVSLSARRGCSAGGGRMLTREDAHALYRAGEETVVRVLGWNSTRPRRR